MEFEPEMVSYDAKVDQTEAADLSKILIHKIKAEIEGKEKTLVATCLVLLASTMLVSMTTDGFIDYAADCDLAGDMTQDGLDAMLSRMGDQVKVWEGRN